MFNCKAVATSLFLLMVVNISHESIAQKQNYKIDTRIIKKGSGEKAIRHSRVSVHYTGWLSNGKKFDSSLDRGEVFEFTIGAGQVIPGWDLGVRGMRVGGKRELIVPPEFGYGSRGAGDAIPPNSTLKFEITLLSVVLPKYTNIDSNGLKKLLSKGIKPIDIRRRDEWENTGIISGSQKITAFDSRGRFIRTFPAGIKQIAARDAPLVLICRSGDRSSAIANMRAEHAGYMQVYNLTGGIVGWLADGNSVVK